MAHKLKILVCVDEEGKVLPHSSEDQISLLQKKGETGVLTFDDARNIQRHRKFFKLLSEVIFHMSEHLSERFPTPESLLHELKLQMGLFELHITLGGKETYKVQSISFAAMSETRFRNFVSDAKDIILKHFLKVSEEDFQEHFMSLIL
jgi:hypothetical protein